MVKGRDKVSPEVILVVDDERNILEIIRLNLELEGYRVVTSESAIEGLRLTRELKPDLVLCDIIMPDMDGLDFCRRVKADGTTNHIPVVLLSARTHARDKLAGIEAGADDFITKPFELSELIARVRINLIRAKQKRDVSPITGLPGSISIEAEIKSRLAKRSIFAALYLDVDHFKAFNDIYGFPTGDKAIRLIATLIDEVVKERGNVDDFIGHAGGDDFVVITTPDKANLLAEEILSRFDRKIRTLYRDEDLRRGYSILVDRQGRERYVPIITLSIGVASNQKRPISTHWEVAEIAKETLKYAKSIPGSTYLVDRRCK